jgi:hypothetical protein
MGSFAIFGHKTFFKDIVKLLIGFGFAFSTVSTYAVTLPAPSTITAGTPYIVPGANVNGTLSTSAIVPGSDVTGSIPFGDTCVTAAAGLVVNLGYTVSATDSSNPLGYGNSCGIYPSSYTTDGAGTNYILLSSTACWSQISGSPVTLCAGNYKVTVSYNLTNTSGNCNGWATDSWSGPSRTGNYVWGIYNPSCIGSNSSQTIGASTTFSLSTDTKVYPPMIYSILNGNAFYLRNGTVTYVKE